MMRLTARCLVVLIGLASTPVLAQSAQELVQGMGQAFREYNYRGTLTYEYGSRIEPMAITHAVIDGLEYEKLTKLTGKPSSIVRSGHELACIHAGDKLLRSGVASESHDSAPIEQVYQFKFLNDDRVAGRPVFNVAVQPRDNLRNGLQLYIDKETGLMLKSVVLSPEGKVLERVQFISLALDSDIPMTEFENAQQTNLANLKHQPLTNTLVVAPNVELAPAWLPEGFVLSGADHEHNASSMMVYSDGLATVSILIEPVSQKTAALVTDGRARRGSMVAYTRPLTLSGARYVLTVMGEVPLFTAARIARHISLREPS